MLNTLSLSQTDAVNSEAVARQSGFVRAQEPLAVGRIVGHEEVDNSGGDDRSNTLEDLIPNSLINSLGLTMGLKRVLTKSHLHPARPLTPSMFSVIKPARRPETAPAMGTDVYSKANRVASSYLRYHEERKKAHPGAKPASANPRRKRMPASWCQFWVAPMRAANVPQTRPRPGRNTLGRTRVRIIFAGTSKTRYETKKSRTMIEYCDEVRPKSSSRPPVLAFLKAFNQ